MADSFQHQEFVRCQATDVLARLPARARAALRYFEVAALLRDYCPAGGPRLAGRRYWTIVVTDWHVYVLPAGTQRGSPAALLQLPLLDVADVVRGAAPGRCPRAGRQQRGTLCAVGKLIGLAVVC
jgi:hypothetical protein